ncbi:MAG TPA: EscT/YscT/HrcT family type III secretion system export apparatus protein [Thiothrix sp.]|nr:EscT/YscT/HrcT family type III secretion system export apparatus protein [Thiothrix sp.]
MEINNKVWMLSWLLASARLLGVFLITPYLGQAVLPGLVRNGIIVVLSLIAVPLVMTQVSDIEYNLLSILGLVFKELFLGLMMGFFFSIPYWAVVSSGYFLDLQRGVFSAELFSPTAGGNTSPLGEFLSRLMIVLLFSTGGFLLMYEVILMSFQSWPVDRFFPVLTPEAAHIVLKQFDLLMYTMALLAGPIIAIMLVIEIGAAIIGRDIPELNVFLLVMPIKSGMTLFILIFYILFLARYFKQNALVYSEKFQLLDAILR